MSSQHSSRINKVLKDIGRRQTIPSNYRATLEKRLVIACKPLTRQPRGKVRRSRSDILSHHKQKKANNVYLEVLDEDPHLFLPFILAISPSACGTFDASELCQRLKQEHPIQLRNDAKIVLDDIANENGIIGSPHYKKLIQDLFREGYIPRPKPITTAESDMHWAYHAADINCIRIIFGDYVGDALESAPRRLREKASTPALQVTECVRTNFPRHNFQDAIISLDIGSAFELARALFPQASYFAGPLSDEHETTEQDNCAYVTLKGASVSAIKSILHSRIHDAIEKAQLRSWEKDCLLLETTDCVRMEMRRSEPQHGTLRLRIEFLHGIRIVKDLYAESASSNGIIQSSTSL